MNLSLVSGDKFEHFFDRKSPGRNKMKVGFIIISHDNVPQLHRLVTTLGIMYGNPPIVCHHDESQSPIRHHDFPANVSFAKSRKTGWGKFSVVQASLSALRILVDQHDPDWFILLSASDYPVASADDVCSALAAANADALIDFRPVGEDLQKGFGAFGPMNPCLAHFEAEGNRTMTARRYIGAQLWLPMLRREPRGIRLGRMTIALPGTSPLHPFSEAYRCLYGDHWFSASRKAARALLTPTAKDVRLGRYLRWRASADECYFQTVLGNRTELRLQRDNRRFAKWNGGGAHPAVLDCNDIEAIFASGAHFARKFRHDSPVLDLIDDRLGLAGMPLLRTAL